MIRNLVSNAMKFTSSNGTVKVSASVWHKSEHIAVEDSRSKIRSPKVFRRLSVYPTKHNYEKEPRDLLVLSVIDSGAGISKALIFY